MLRAYRPKPREEVRRNMSAIRSRDNRVEGALRRALHRMGLRYRKYRHDLPGRPDIVFSRERIAIFVDGDYWHCRVLREEGPKAFYASLKTPTPESRHYWIMKFERRVEIDRGVNDALREAGWLVIRLWESDVKPDIHGAAERLADVIRARRGASSTNSSTKISLTASRRCAPTTRRG